MVSRAWHIVTGEYPPMPGGVSDYSRSVAVGLAAAGDAVHVWAPANDGQLAQDQGVRLHPLTSGYGPRGLYALSRGIQREPGPRRILVQYVAQGFGLQGANVPFCAWIASLGKDDEVYVMFHEVALPWAPLGRWRWNAAAAAMRIMATLLLARADRVFVSTPSWEPTLRAFPVRWKGAVWLPVPSNVEAPTAPGARSRIRSRLGIDESASVVGHFGTYGSLTAPLLAEVLESLLQTNLECVALLLGRGSDAFARRLHEPDSRRIIATGTLDAAQLTDYLLACDVLVQPYPDGVSTRRTSTMAGLAVGLPIATNHGHLTEPIWRESSAVEIASDMQGLAAAADRLLRDGKHAGAVAARGRRLYEERFSLEHVVAALRS